MAILPGKEKSTVFEWIFSTPTARGGPASPSAYDGCSNANCRYMVYEVCYDANDILTKRATSRSSYREA